LKVKPLEITSHDFDAIQLRNLDRYKSIVDDWPLMMDYLKRPLMKTGWLNPLKTSFSSFRASDWLDPEDYTRIAWRPNGLKFKKGSKIGKSLAYDLGLLHIQEEASMLPVHVLEPCPGERVLDFCAAPGNKTAEIAVRMDNTGTLVANDIEPMRLRGLKITANRLGLLNLVTTVRDGRDFQGSTDYFDRVLVDAPCSCEGTLRKNPTVLNHKIKPFQPFANGLQIGLLNKAIKAAKPGGVVVYSTCTFRPEENEAVIDSILRKNNVELEKVAIPGFRLQPGILEWGAQQFHPSLSLTARVWPHHNDTSGFFIARLKKRYSH